ncbi:MAG: hypothetical protein JWO03_478 [Bacteroidetes bacterium]|nr:hypothetical protein [Bacteroidota bacterium]
MKTIWRISVFLLLTLLTQVGGFIYLLCLPVFHRIDKKQRNNYTRGGLKLAFFLIVYISLSLLVVPTIAGLFGRVPLPVSSSGNIRPNSLMTCLMNRHYVRKELLNVLNRASAEIKLPIYYLDASFPFINGFPLLPHWSHNDGKKLDLTYYYSDKMHPGELQGSPSWMGYGFCEEPKPGEEDMPCDCARKGFHQYSMLRPLVPASLHEKYEVNTAATERLIRTLASDPSVSMIFIEPHLKQRWKLSDVNKIKFHGCHAVRHDDHVHVQIR